MSRWRHVGVAVAVVTGISACATGDRPPPGRPNPSRASVKLRRQDDKVRIVSRKPSRKPSGAHLDPRGIERTSPLDRWVYLSAAEREVALLEQEFRSIESRETRDELEAQNINPRKVHDQLAGAKEDLGLLRQTNDAAWERYQVRLDNTIHDVRDSLGRATAR